MRGKVAEVVVIQVEPEESAERAEEVARDGLKVVGTQEQCAQAALQAGVVVVGGDVRDLITDRGGKKGKKRTKLRQCVLNWLSALGNVLR